jgi:uncharacterized glyoxalase superfamily protein PhnB
MEHLELTFVVYARDFARTVEFYKRALLLEQIDIWDRDESQGARFLVTPGSVIEVFGAPGPGIDEQTQVSGVSLGLSTDDVDGFYDHLKAEGIDCTEPTDEWWGGRCIYVFDPNGLTVLLSQSAPN